MTLDQLNLAPIMDQAARQFEWAFSHVQWLSGRRNRQGQAQAMAAQIVKDRQWISKTYLHAAHLQTAVDFHPDAKTTEQLNNLLFETMLGMSDSELAKVSDHIAGMAVDLAPMIFGDGDPTPTGQAALKWMHDYPYTKVVLTREGGRIIWHWACNPEPRRNRGSGLA